MIPLVDRSIVAGIKDCRHGDGDGEDDDGDGDGGVGDGDDDRMLGSVIECMLWSLEGYVGVLFTLCWGPSCLMMGVPRRVRWGLT